MPLYSRLDRNDLTSSARVAIGSRSEVTILEPMLAGLRGKRCLTALPSSSSTFSMRLCNLYDSRSSDANECLCESVLFLFGLKKHSVFSLQLPRSRNHIRVEDSRGKSTTSQISTEECTIIDNDWEELLCREIQQLAKKQLADASVLKA